MRIGFIGQGFVGKNIANDFEARGYQVVRYALESEYVRNRELIRSCDITFIAVPTPTTPRGFDYSIVESSLELIGTGNVVVISRRSFPEPQRSFRIVSQGLSSCFHQSFSVNRLLHTTHHIRCLMLLAYRLIPQDIVLSPIPSCVSFQRANTHT